MPYGTLNADTITNSNGLSGNAIGPGFKNRIINGDMRIDQRNAGAAVTINGTSNTYTLDRWVAAGQNTDGVFTVDQVTDVPASAGFTNSTKVTVTTADASIGSTQNYLFFQFIEGNNFADAMFGTANAKTITVSFWVRSSVTGTFGGALNNSANDRNYPFTYTISVADTWEYKTVTVAGDTSGTWLTNNGRGITVRFSFGSGSSHVATAGSWTSTSSIYGATGQTQLISTLNATWYITGVQLEVSPSATSFDYRPYGTELALCQRYYYRFTSRGVGYFGCGTNNGTTNNVCIVQFPVPMRTAPTALEQSGTAGNYQVQQGATNTTCSAVPAYNYADTESATVQSTVASGLTIGYAAFLRAVNSSGYLGWSAEL